MTRFVLPRAAPSLARTEFARAWASSAESSGLHQSLDSSVNSNATSLETAPRCDQELRAAATVDWKI